MKTTRRTFVKTTTAALGLACVSPAWATRPEGPLQAGDVVFITAQECNREELECLREEVDRAVPTGVKVLVVNFELEDVTVLRGEQAKDREEALEWLAQFYADQYPELFEFQGKLREVFRTASSITVEAVVDGKTVRIPVTPVT